jgi:hypothetical protein
MRIFRILTAIRILVTTLGTTAANAPGIPVATKASRPVAIYVAKHHERIDILSPLVLEGEVPYSAEFLLQRLLVLNRSTEKSCASGRRKDGAHRPSLFSYVDALSPVRPPFRSSRIQDQGFSSLLT